MGSKRLTSLCVGVPVLVPPAPSPDLPFFSSGPPKDGLDRRSLVIFRSSDRGELIRVRRVFSLSRLFSFAHTRFLSLLTVPLPGAAKSDDELASLEKWLLSYNPKDLFDVAKNDKHATGSSSLPADVINDKALRIVPVDETRRMGFSKVRSSRSRF